MMRDHGADAGFTSEHLVGDIVLRARERYLSGPEGETVLEPRIVDVLVELAVAPGSLVSREDLLRRCWGSYDASDESLNRCVYQLRKALAKVGSVAVQIDTVAALGYVLRTKETLLGQAMDAARFSWRSGLATDGDEAITALAGALRRGGAAPAEAWGELALLLARAAEYAPAESCAVIIRRCETAAAKALSIDLSQPDARVALSSLCPLYGDWLGKRTRLVEVLGDAPRNFAARHELAVLEMATGRPSEAVPIVFDLLRDDPLAATLHYKRGYHLFCLGHFDEMDRVLDNALQVWPGHAAIWQSRVMTLAFTGRAEVALSLLFDQAQRPPMPAASLVFHQTALRALAGAGRPNEADVAMLAENASVQSLAVAAIMYLSAIGAVEQAMATCERYYLRDGDAPVRLRYEAGIEASINDLHRRATQPLFLPVTAPLRAHPRFARLCDRMGLAEYWKGAGVVPDFLA
jgi:DNA-binding winged helix-turn-helix (wHTH) protein/thioredoxin-like negative regulator of GroEL